MHRRVRYFSSCVLCSNFKLGSKKYYELVHIVSFEQQPPAFEKFRDTEIEECLIKLLKVCHLGHNQTVERHVKLVTEASAQV